MDDSYSLTSARAHLGELVSRARYSHRPVAITEHGKPSVAIINIDDLADLEDRAALAAHYAARLAGRSGDGLRLVHSFLDTLPPRLREIADLRLRHPTLSLRELALRCDPPATKSAAHRRLQRLVRLARP